LHGNTIFRHDPKKVSGTFVKVHKSASIFLGIAAELLEKQAIGPLGHKIFSVPEAGPSGGEKKKIINFWKRFKGIDVNF